MVDACQRAGVKLWHTTTNGLDHVDVAYITAKGIPLAHAAGPQSAIALAEHALSMILYFNKNLQLNQAQHWKERVLNSELKGQVLGWSDWARVHANWRGARIISECESGR